MITTLRSVIILASQVENLKTSYVVRIKFEELDIGFTVLNFKVHHYAINSNRPLIENQ